MERARVGIGASLPILLLLLLAVCMPVAAKPVVLEMVTLDDFDHADAQRWAVYGSKFSNAEFPIMTFVNAYPESLFGRFYADRDKLRALGVRSRWDRKGYNYFELVPVAKGEDGALVPTPLPIRGQVNRLDLWVWGGNYNYYAEVHVMDYRGVPHALFLGDLNYQGWKNLSVQIPSYIPQGVKWIPQERPLSVTKIVIWTRPDERVDDFFIYFDELKVLSDVAENRFDGDELALPSYVEETWKNAAKGR